MDNKKPHMEKEALDRNTKRMIYEDLLEQQEKVVNERAVNLKYFEPEHKRLPPLPKTLVSKVERIQKFINQLKGGVSEQTHDALIDEFQQINLKHYIPEVAKSISQNKMGQTERETLLLISVMMHQRYETYSEELQRYKTFSEELIPEVEKQYYESAMPSQSNRKRNLLRMLTELYFKGLFVDYRRIFKCLNQLIKLNYEPQSRDDLHSEEQFEHALIMITDYMKTYGERIFQILPRDHREDINNDYEVTLKDCDRHEFLDSKTRKKIYEYLKEDYYEKKCIDFTNMKFKKLKHAQQAYYDNQKEVQIDIQLEAHYLLLKEEFLKLEELVKDIANVLDVEMPKYVIEEVKISQMAVSKKQDSLQQQIVNQSSWDPFEDELSYKMYILLPDFKRFAQSETNNNEDQVETTRDSELEELTRKLQKSQSIYQIDQRAEEIIKQISRHSQGKGMRKKISRILFNAPRQIQLLPFYSRFTAIMTAYYPEIGSDLAKLLEQEFWEIQKDHGKIESKIRNIRFIGELTKFSVSQPQVILECFKALLDNFIGYNIELVCHLLESCGSFLLRIKTDAVPTKTNNLLDILWRLKEKEPITSHQLQSLEQAYFQCRPQEFKGAIVKSEQLTIVQLYIQHLLTVRLIQADPHGQAEVPQSEAPYTPSKDLDSVINIILKLPWRENYDFIFKQMQTLISSTKLNDMDNIAVLLAVLKQTQRNFVIGILDHLFEQVIRGIEENDFKDAQRRISLIKFIGCLYNYKVVHTDTIFTLLFKFINIDMNSNKIDQRLQDLDDPGDCFRVRIVCTLLDALGRSYFLKHKRRLLMDRFLIFFQRYIFQKTYILMDLEFMLLDTFENLRPKQAPKVHCLEEANEACTRILQAEAEQNSGDALGTVIGVISYYCYKKDQKDFQNIKGNMNYDDYGAEEEAPVSEIQGNNVEQAREEETERVKIDIKSIKQQQQLIVDELDQQELQNFDAEFEHMMSESTNQARKEAAGISHLGSQLRKEIVIPIQDLKRKMPQIGQETGMIFQYALVTKQGKKTNFHKLNLTTESKVVIQTQERMKIEEQEKKNEKQRMRDITIKIAEDQAIRDYSSEEESPSSFI